MFRPHEHTSDGTGGPATGAVQLSRAQMLDAPDSRGRIARLHHAIEQRWHAWDIADDLAEDLGTGRWYRGFATMLALSAMAIGCWPDFTMVDAASAMPLESRARDEFRSQMIMPLAMGANSGRRMAPSAAVLPLEQAPDRPMIHMVATLGQGDSFGRMLQRAGVGGADAAQVAAMVSAVMPVGGVAPGTRFDITLGKRASPQEPRPLAAVAG